MADLKFVKDVHDESVNELLDEIIAAADAGETHIRLLLQTCGGDLNAAFAGYDYMRLLQRERELTIETVGMGYCLSAGVVLLQAGNKRYATPHTIFMLHQPEQYPWDDSKSGILPDELDGRMQLSNVTRALLASIFAAREGGKGQTDWLVRLKGMPTTFFDTHAALTYRLIDETLPVD